MSTPPSTPRLHVLMAREAPYAVVIRRGPSKWCCSIGWDRSTDTFTLGQWLKGRIYADRCDISPDGRHWIYFVLNGKWDSITRGTYTALARTPWLKATGLWPRGDTWGGGGFFLDSSNYWVDWSAGWVLGRKPLIEPEDLKRSNCGPEPITEIKRIQSMPVRRLLRDGWTHRRWQLPGSGYAVDAFEKRLGSGWLLRKCPFVDRTSAFPREVHELQHLPTATTTLLDKWEWADVDGDRVVWIEEGQLFAGKVTNTGIEVQRRLFDFRPMAFERRVAPY